MYHLAGWVVAFLPNTLIGGATVIPEVGFDVATVGVGVHGGIGPGRSARAGRAGHRIGASGGRRTTPVTLVPGAPGFYHHLMAVEDAERSPGLGPVAHLRHRAAERRPTSRRSGP